MPFLRPLSKAYRGGLFGGRRRREGTKVLDSDVLDRITLKRRVAARRVGETSKGEGGEDGRLMMDDGRKAKVIKSSHRGRKAEGRMDPREIANDASHRAS